MLAWPWDAATQHSSQLTAAAIKPHVCHAQTMQDHETESFSTRALHVSMLDPVTSMCRSHSPEAGKLGSYLAPASTRIYRENSSKARADKPLTRQTPAHTCRWFTKAYLNHVLADSCHIGDVYGLLGHLQTRAKTANRIRNIHQVTDSHTLNGLASVRMCSHHHLYTWSLFEGQLWKRMPVCDDVPFSAQTTFTNRLATGVFTGFESRSLQKTTSNTPVKLIKYLKTRSQHKLAAHQSSRDGGSSMSVSTMPDQPFLSL